MEDNKLIQELHHYALKVKKSKGLKSYPLNILIGAKARQYLEAKEKMTGKKEESKDVNGFFDWEDVEIPAILILNPNSPRVKVTIQHEMQHFEQLIKGTLEPVEYKRRSSFKLLDWYYKLNAYYSNPSEQEAFKSGEKGFSEKEHIAKFSYSCGIFLNNLFFAHPIIGGLVLLAVFSAAAYFGTMMGS